MTIPANLTSETDYDNDLTTSYIYDQFGRLEKGISADGTISASALRWVTLEDADAPVFSVYYIWKQTSGKAPMKTYYSNLGLELRSVTYGFNDEVIYVDTYYNVKGQVAKKSLPYALDSETPRFGEYTYDMIGRLKTATMPDESGSAINTNTYNGFTTSTKNALNQINTKIVNAAGWTIKSTDASGNSVVYSYFADGAIDSIEVADYSNTSRKYKYDNAGYLAEYEDAAQGKISYKYNAYGQLLYEINANQQITEFTEYDLLGRLLSKTTLEGEFTYKYDKTKLGLLDSVISPTDTISYTYDDLLRPIKQTEITDGKAFITTFEYDELGRLQHLTYPSGFRIRNTYTNSGYPLAIIDTENDQKLWTAVNMNSSGQYTTVNVGNIQQIIEYYQNSGRIWKIRAQGLQDNIYTWDKGGNLTSRKSRIGKNEVFDYDNLNRIKNTYYDGQSNCSYNYDALGNISDKSDVGHYSYEDANNPYKLTSINNQPHTINNDNQDIYYNSFNKVYKITERHPDSSKIERQLDLVYGVDNNRIKQIVSEKGNITSAKLYIGGSYEVETKLGITSLIHYINAPTGLVAIVTKEGKNKKTEFVLNDNLGSLQILATREGVLIEEYSYDAWGNRRDPITFEVFSTLIAGKTSYGFTGHEHLDLFMLVNMDGRMYDPVVGRFLSPDPVLQFPNYTQGLNPYSYVLNNPLRFIDPSGYSLIGQGIAIGLSILVAPISPVLSAFVYSVVMTIDYAIELGRAANFDNLSEHFIKTFVMSAISNGGTSVIGGIFGNVGKFANEFKRAIAHGAFNGAMRMTQGGKFEHGFLSGFASSLGGSFIQAYGSTMSGAEQIAISAVIGGTAESLGGGKFANGAVTGAYVMALNHMSQGWGDDGPLPTNPKKPAISLNGNAKLGVGFGMKYNIGGLQGGYVISPLAQEFAMFNINSMTGFSGQPFQYTSTLDVHYLFGGATGKINWSMKTIELQAYVGSLKTNLKLEGFKITSQEQTFSIAAHKWFAGFIGFDVELELNFNKTVNYWIQSETEYRKAFNGMNHRAFLH